MADSLGSFFTTSLVGSVARHACTTIAGGLLFTGHIFWGVAVITGVILWTGWSKWELGKKLDLAGAFAKGIADRF